MDIQFIALLVAVLANGTFGVTHKMCLCSNEVFTLWHIVGNALVTGATIPLLPLLRHEITFAPLAVASGFLQFVAIQCVFRSIELAGVALANVTLAGSVIVFAVAGDILVLHELPKHPLLLCAAVVLILLALALAGFAQKRAQRFRATPNITTAHDTAAFHSTVSTHSELEESLCADDAASAQECEDTLPLSSPTADVVPPSSPSRRGSMVRTISTTMLSRAESRVNLQQVMDTMVPRPASRAVWASQLLGCNVCIGVCVYAANAMVLLSPEPLQGVSFAWSFGVGMLASAPLLPLVFHGLHGRRPRVADLGSRTDACFGLACGAIWGIAYVGIDVAIGGGIEESTALSVFQCSIFVAGLWGIALGELRGRTPIAIFFIACLILCGGVVAKMLSV